MSNISQWSMSAGDNNAAPPDGWPEGMARDKINDTARETHAAVARWYNDTQGTLVSGGSSNAYTLTTGSANVALADQSMLVFRANHANTGAATLNVDSLGAKAIQAIGGSALPANSINANDTIIVVWSAERDAYVLFSAALAGIDTARINDGAITLAKMQSGTQGQLLYYGASGVPARLAIGTAGYALASVDGLPAYTLAENLAATTSFGTNGYMRMPGGGIIQWGVSNSLGQATQTISFPLTFPTACRCVVATPNVAGSVANGDKRDHWKCTDQTTSSFILRSWFELSSVSYNWLAVGN